MLYTIDASRPLPDAGGSLVRKLFFLALVVLAAAATSVAATSQAAQPKRNTLVIALQELGTSIDPSTYQASSMTLLQATLEPLVFYAMRNVSGSPVEVFDSDKFTPGVVQSWSIHPKYRSVTMTLRRGVKSPFGNELTTADVKWTVERNLATRSLGGVFMFGQANINATTGMAAQRENLRFMMHLLLPRVWR